MFEDVPRDPSLADPLPGSPLELLGRWLDEVRELRVQRDPWAMCVASMDETDHPSARMVICRGYDAVRGHLVFHTNRQSRKGRELAARPNAAAVFHWDALARQVRIEGPVDLLPDAESDAYFATRPRPAQIAAWASRQSEPIANRRALLDELAETESRFADQPQIQRPPHWGGYRLWLAQVELWVGAEGRAHDRGLWTRALRSSADGFVGGAWSVARLQP